MAYVARATRLIQVPARVAFDRLADHDSWPRWMPASFRPVGKTVGRLAEGASFQVTILGRLPAKCRVQAVRSPDELTWCGGKRGVLWAEHRFLFEPKGAEAVEVQSVETWSGPLAALLRPAILPGAVRVGREQLEALAGAVGN
jgi:uncharacterized protein YndB with AHSA1/START domain